MATHSSILAWRIPMDRGAWWAIVHGVTKSQTQLSNKAPIHGGSSHLHLKAHDKFLGINAAKIRDKVFFAVVVCFWLCA